MAIVSRRDRFVDLAALALILAGIALYLYGTRRLREITKLSYQHPGPQGLSQRTVADHARYECNAGIGLAIAGCVVGVAAAVRHARGRRAVVS